MKLIAALIVWTVMIQPAQAQNEFKDKIESQRYTFEAQSMTPQRGGMRQLTPGYIIQVTKDTIVADLPYMGRSYTGGYSSTDGGVKFTSTDFEYTVTEKKKGGWKISIRPKDVANSPRVMIDVSTKGYASVNVTSNDKASISYYGTIQNSKR